MNDTSGVSTTLLWETFKAFLRGCIVLFQASQNERRKAEQVELERAIEQLGSENTANPSIEKHSKISALKYKLNQSNRNNLNLVINHTNI